VGWSNGSGGWPQGNGKMARCNLGQHQILAEGQNDTAESIWLGGDELHVSAERYVRLVTWVDP
jgi:hypothetical protein